MVLPQDRRRPPNGGELPPLRHHRPRRILDTRLCGCDSGGVERTPSRLKPASRASLPFAPSRTQAPFFVLPDAGKAGDPGSASRGPHEGTPQRRQNRRASPVPGRGCALPGKTRERYVRRCSGCSLTLPSCRNARRFLLFALEASFGAICSRNGHSAAPSQRHALRLSTVPAARAPLTPASSLQPAGNLAL